MTVNDFIKELEKKEIKVTFSSGKLKYSGPEDHITPELIKNLKKYKGKLIKYFWPEEFTNLMPINTEGEKIPLFIIHGDNSNYIISKHFGRGQPVYGFFHPGSEGEAIRYKSVKEMAEDYIKKLLAIQPRSPIYLIGFSFGGILAFEMAVQLQKSGYDIPFLVLIDCINPIAKEPLRWYRNIFKLIRKNILGPVRRRLERNIKLLICKSYILVKKPVPVNRRNFYMVNKYQSLASRYLPSKFNGDILLFRAKENSSSYKYLGWETLVNNLKMIKIEGHHLTIFSDKNTADILATEIEDYLTSIVKSH